MRNSPVKPPAIRDSFYKASALSMEPPLVVAMTKFGKRFETDLLQFVTPLAISEDTPFSSFSSI
jgi:hypothetical protein